MIWYRIADKIADIKFEENEMTTLEVNGRKICLAQYNDHVYAVSNLCPHAGGVMADGYIDAAGNIVCPIHCYRFNCRNGWNTSGEGYKLKTFPVEQREDGIFIGIGEGS